MAMIRLSYEEYINLRAVLSSFIHSLENIKTKLDSIGPDACPDGVTIIARWEDNNAPDREG